MRAKLVMGLVGVVALVGCARGTKQGLSAQTSAAAAQERKHIRELPGLAEALLEERVPGVVAVLHEGDGELLCSSAERCGQRVVPASTFKIPNALIGLETGVIADANFVIPWDGQKRDMEEWNRDHTLRSAIEVSAVPYFQELARRVGPERMASWVQKLGYGNARIGSKVDRFWLDGPLAISPVEQIDFLQRFAAGTLPVSARALQVVRDCLVLDQRKGAVLRGKTGWAYPGTADEIGWFVGYVERANERSYVAVLLFGGEKRDGEHFRAARRRVAERSLATLGLW